MSEFDDDADLAPGDEYQAHGDAIPGAWGYFLGLVLAGLLTALSFTLPGTAFIWGPGIPVALVVFAVAQMGVHLVFFLHITTAPDNTNNVLALAFGILIVALLIGGSVWIMANMNQNMMPMPQQGMSTPMRH
jgi:cytochrome o ubiquinol oxidase subunit IV